VRRARAALLPAAAIPLLAGSLGGAIGVCAAFPFDTIKTKAQTFEGDRRGGGMEGGRQGTNMLAVATRVVQTEGIGGFYGGVSTMMVGQALIKALAFACNDWALTWQGVSPESTTLPQLCAAALFSGFVTSFLVNPFERVKILCQASAVGTYKNGLQCAQEIINTDGYVGFMGRGLGPTLARETPSYGLYFVLYAVLMDSPLSSLGILAPLVCGALSGCGSWVPVYPIDVVKTQIQNTQGEEQAPSALQAARDLYAAGGFAMFWDGLDSKMLRAATNHAVTFFVYDLVVANLEPLAR
jgi:solute carrier family 25 carnitine/acylcarnitine transporter 20/29